jgi:phenylpyruvate tautomerase PptA (4-oxalocrotonate tautomerase family)
MTIVIVEDVSTRCESRIRPREAAMPMIDAYASAGTFADKHKLAMDLAGTLMRIEQVPDIPMFRKNTAAFVHEMPSDSLSNVDGDASYVRVQVLTNAGALDRDKQLQVVRQFTDIVAAAAGDPALADRTWVLITEAPDGGWGLAGHANTNAELVAAARAQIAELAAERAERAGE